MAQRFSMGGTSTEGCRLGCGFSNDSIYNSRRADTSTTELAAAFWWLTCPQKEWPFASRPSLRALPYWVGRHAEYPGLLKRNHCNQEAPSDFYLDSYSKFTNQTSKNEEG